jgi:16S rRNA (adenine1518-N6/adenine1519-N6)-dimethyltransferase
VILAERDREPDSSSNNQREGAIEPLSWLQKPKPPTLPPGLFAPKMSLSQNFLADPNYIFKMVSALKDSSPDGSRVIELGPGTGALTSRLAPRYPKMIGVELDQRAMRILAQKVPGTTVIRSDVLLVNYTKLAEIRGGPLNVIGNLPYHVTSQVLFTLADHARAVDSAYVTMQREVAERIVARPNSKKYGILSVAFQLYSDPKILFDLPPTAFFPRPNVISSYVKLDFKSAEERRLDLGVDPRDLRNFTNMAFRQRRKMLSNSLAKLLQCHTTLVDELPPEYAKLRPEQMEPWEFVHLTQMIFGKKEFPKHLRRAWRGEFGRTVRD